MVKKFIKIGVLIILSLLVFSRTSLFYKYYSAIYIHQTEKRTYFDNIQKSDIVLNDRIKLTDNIAKETIKIVDNLYQKLINEVFSYRSLHVQLKFFKKLTENKPIFKNFLIPFPFHNFY